MLFESISIGLYLLASIIFLVNTLLDIDVPKTKANIAILVLMCIIWPLPVLIYLISGRK